LDSRDHRRWSISVFTSQITPDAIARMTVPIVKPSIVFRHMSMARSWGVERYWLPSEPYSARKYWGLCLISGCWARNVASAGYGCRYTSLFSRVGSIRIIRGSDGGYAFRTSSNCRRVSSASRVVTAVTLVRSRVWSAGEASRAVSRA
jgi:hypothetical protein